MKTIYVSSLDNRSWSDSPLAFGGRSYMIDVDDSFMGGGMTCNPVTREWTPDPAPVRTEQDNINDYNACKSDILSFIPTVTRGWEIDLRLDTITDEDKQKLITWRAYEKLIIACTYPEEFPPLPEL